MSVGNYTFAIAPLQIYVRSKSTDRAFPRWRQARSANREIAMNFRISGVLVPRRPAFPEGRGGKPRRQQGGGWMTRRQSEARGWRIQMSGDRAAGNRRAKSHKSAIEEHRIRWQPTFWAICGWGHAMTYEYGRAIAGRASFLQLAPRRALVAICSVSLLLTCFTCLEPEEARADEPVTVGTVVTWALVTAAAWGVGKALDAAFAKKPPKEKATRTTTVQCCLPDGTKLTKTQTQTVEPTLTDASPIAQMTFPGDWVPSTTIPGDLTSGTVTAQINSVTQTLSETTSNNFQVGFNALDTISSLGGVSGEEVVNTDVTVDNYFVPPAGNVNPTDLLFNLSGNVGLTTTNFSNTTATDAYLITLKSAELGTLFSGGYSIDQGSTTVDTLGGGIPGAIIDVTSPGNATIDLSGADFQFPIPADISFLDISVSTDFTNTADVDGGVTCPEPSSLIMLGTGILGLLLRCIRRRRRNILYVSGTRGIQATAA